MKRRGKADSQVVVVGQGLHLLGVIQQELDTVCQGDGMAHLLTLHRVQELSHSLGGGREGEREAVGIPCTPLGLEDGLGAEGIRMAIGSASQYCGCPPPLVPGLTASQYRPGTVVIPPGQQGVQRVAR